MAVREWVGGTGDFTDPDFWSNGGTIPASPPGAGDLAIYEADGTVMLSGNANAAAEIQQAAMTFDVSGGGYQLINTVEGPSGLQLKQGGALTITGAGEVDASYLLTSDSSNVLVVTDNAVLNIIDDVSNSSANIAFGSTLIVSDSGVFETQGTIELFVSPNGAAGVETVQIDSGSVLTYSLYSDDTDLTMQGGVMAVSAAAGSMSDFTDGTYDLEVFSTIAVGAGGLSLGQDTGTVQGSSTIAVAGLLEIADGSLVIANQGTVSGQEVDLYTDQTSSLSVGVTAGLLVASGLLYMEADPAGATVMVGVGTGGVVSAGTMAIGGAAGNVTVTVIGGTLASSGSLVIAEAGTAALVIGAGGTEMAGGPLLVGELAASRGTDSVTGAGAVMIVQGAGTIGVAGSGTLVIAAGARGTFAAGVTLGDAGDGHLFVSASTLTATGDEIFGEGGTGTLSILAQGLDAATGKVIFGAAGGSAVGQVTSGTLAFGGTLTVGDNGTGTLSIQSTGSVFGTGAATQVAIGAQGGSAGTLSVLSVLPNSGTTGGGTLSAGSLGVGGSEAAAGGSGTLIVAPNAKALFSGDAQVWGSGVIEIYGGTLSADDLRIAAGGTLTGNGMVIGPAEIDGSVLVSGNNGLQATTGPLIFLNNVSGNGTLETGPQQTLVVDAAVAAGNTILFTGLGGALDLGAPSAMLGTLTNFAAGDQIDLVGIEATQALLVGSAIEITNDGALVADIATSDLTGVPGFDVASDNNGGTLITISDAATGPAGTPSYPGAPLVTTVPAGINAIAGAETSVTGIAITDSSAGTGVTVTALVTAQNGLLTADAASGGQITGFNGGMAVQISGDLAEVNADLATLAYQGGAAGSDTLTVDSGDSVGDSDGHVIAVTIEPPCFCTGTRIMTTRGAMAVEALAIGDRVVTAAGGDRPIVWLGHRRIEAVRHRDPEQILPVRVAVDAFGPGLPMRDLFLSPDHAVFADGALIPIKHLINGRSIAQVPRQSVEYWHVELDRHDILVAEGLPAESYLDTGNRSAFANGGAVAQMHADFSPLGWDDACAELVQAGPRVIALRRRLFARAGVGPARPVPHLRVLAEQHDMPPRMLAHDVIAYRIPAGIRAVHLLSPAWSPCDYDAASLDRRRLGVRMFAAVFDGVPIDLTDPILFSGFHPIEDTAEGRCRWTTGDARLVLPVGASVLVLRIGDGATALGAAA